jgi:hypothetical protein
MAAVYWPCKTGGQLVSSWEFLDLAPGQAPGLGRRVNEHRPN